MKTTKIKSLVILIVTTLTMSCSKDDNPTPIAYEEENPLQGYITTAGLDLNTPTTVVSGSLEYGFKFKPTVKGKINVIVVKTPATVAGEYSVRFYDPITFALIRTEPITITGPNIEITKTISPLELEANKEYVITFASNKLYRRTRSDGLTITYPITSGNILITGVVSKPDITSPYPSNNHYNRYDGDVSFKFQRTE